MEIRTIDSFLNYYQRTRKITNQVIQVIPPDKLDWSYKPGKFTLGDLVRHIAAIERNLFAEVILGNKSVYRGCGKNLADGYDHVISFFNEMHQQSIQIYKSLSDRDLQKEIKTLDGKLTTVANFLRALIVHEIHHRGVMCIYLNLINVTTPPVIGLSESQVIEFSK
ncbi:MAG: DinB family protein [Bacteroidetes bacterium]|jgi:uncharacterized damage-inducible protein DinB|nr:DinB family protein [Bacteroidota bacterium]